MTTETPRPISRTQRNLAYVIAGLVIVSLIAIIAIIVGTWAGAGVAQSAGEDWWPLAFYVPMFGLPAAFILMMILLFLSVTNRSKQNSQSQ